MEIDITAFVRNAEPSDFSASRAELGNDAGKITWNNAVREASTTRLIGADDRAEFESWAREFGAWSKEEIEGWSLDDCNALLIQYISGNLREMESLCYSNDDEFGIDWSEAEKLSSTGTIGGNIFKGDNGAVYFYMGS